MKWERLVPGGAQVHPIEVERYQRFVKDQMDKNEERIRREVFGHPEVIEHFTQINPFDHYVEKKGKTRPQLLEGFSNLLNWMMLKCQIKDIYFTAFPKSGEKNMIANVNAYPSSFNGDKRERVTSNPECRYRLI